MSDPLVLGIDVGTTACKTAVVDQGGGIVAQATARYAVAAPQPGWGEQNPDDVVAGVAASVRDCTRQIDVRAVKAVCLAGALHSIVPVDNHDRPLMPALVWTDTRSTLQAERLRKTVDAPLFYERTGCPVHSTYPLAKLLWMRERTNDVFAAAKRFISIKEYVVHRLTGQWVVDHSIASGTGLFNLTGLDWDEDILNLIGIDVSRLSEIVSTRTNVGRLTKDAATLLGLPDTDVFIGAGDGALSSLGAGGIESGVFVLMVGSSGAVRSFARTPILDKRCRSWCYVLDDQHYLVGGAINNAGIVFQWLLEQVLKIGDPSTYDQVIEEAQEVLPGANGLVFLPYLTGERSPGWNSHSRGVLFGLSLHHGRSHIVRAVLESVGFRLRTVLAVVEELLGTATEIRLSGGFVRSPAWVQIVADIIGRPLLLPATPDTSALGAALFGWCCLDKTDLGVAAAKVQVQGRVEPDPRRHDMYADPFLLFNNLYDLLVPAFAGNLPDVASQ